MCGICGFTGEKNRMLLGRMLDLIRHRGPDDAGEHFSPGINMGMRRLSIIDIAGGHQPFYSEDKRFSLVFNGEIYNFIELREELMNLGRICKSDCDTEVIIRGFEEWGESVLDRLNGMFAFALWDASENKLLLARDRYGIKPLFYAHTAKSFIFGSEIKNLLEHPATDKTLDRTALNHYLSLRNIPAPFTVYRDIRTLLPGHTLSWSENEGIKISRWYELPMGDEYHNTDKNELEEIIDSALRESVRIRLRSDVGYGAYLSGGIDSSAIVAIMSELCDKPVKTFSLGFADAPTHKQDIKFARMVAQRYDTEHHEYFMSAGDLGRDLPKIVKHLDQPFAGVLSSYWLSQFMKQHVTVALSGDGADDIFASYGHHRLVPTIEQIRKARQKGVDPKSLKLEMFAGREDYALAMAELNPWEWRLSYGAFTEKEKRDLLSGRGREFFDTEKTSEFLRGIYSQCPSNTDQLNKILWLDIKTLLPNEILYFNDMLSMAHSLEVRTPFLDYRLVRIACNIPGEMKIKGTTLKHILRKTVRRYLPQEIVDRPKEGFVLPKNTWMREGLRDIIATHLREERLSAHGLFDGKSVNRLTQKFLDGDDSVTFKVWSLIILHLWLESENILL